MEPTEERKARLKALRAEAESCGLVPARCADDEPPAKELKFRSYVPHDDELRAAKVEEAHAPEPVAEPPPPPPEPADAEELLVGAVPKKANWDLRRDVAKKMEKLDRRTQWAIVELAHAEEKARMQLA